MTDEIKRQIDPALNRDGKPMVDAPSDKSRKTGDDAFSRDAERRRQEEAAEGNRPTAVPIGRAGQIPPD